MAVIAAGAPAPAAGAANIPIDLASIPKIGSAAAASTAATTTASPPASTKPNTTAAATTPLATPATTAPKPAAGSAAAAAAGTAAATASKAAPSAAAAAPGDEPAPAEKDADTEAQNAAAQAAAASIEVDLASIPKVDVSGPVVTSGGSTSVGQGNAGAAKRAATKAVPLTEFDPVWPAGKRNNENQVLVDVVTDSPIDVIKTNQIPFIQSLADALGVSTKQVYWYNLTESDLNTATFLVDSDSDAAKKTVLGNLANPDNTARFYSNAAAYTLNILNGPEVAPQELNLGADVISTPDNYKAYDGDTGLISNNATAAATSSAHTPTAGTGLASLMLSLGAAALAVIALA
ncbi:hypothetical protein OEZ85_004443 [Tetradesmus obliquus]|uniref:FAS1 domain-containing protein n=1 Tax=Tetradesmus obliquus TaxID=3088 RepID=A0ABY8UP03_TETOB|nr:hypothetical protein OEZ85_004443 [Tetradesmus obliquus]